MNQCTQERKRSCASRSGPYLEAVCAKCRRKGREPGLYFSHLWWIYRLQVAGFDWNNDDIGLPLETWEDLAVLVEEMEVRKMRVLSVGKYQ